MQVDLQVEVPKGFELTGEYRSPKTGEFYLTNSNTAIQASIDFVSSWLILRKVDTWRDATLDDLKRVMDGETVECRVWDDNGWRGGFTLRGWQASGETHRTWYVWNSSEFGYYYKKVQIKE
jgi:hypothetical protein